MKSTSTLMLSLAAFTALFPRSQPYILWLTLWIYTHIGLPSALCLSLAGADSCGEPKAFAVTARRQISGKYFRTDSQCGTSFAHFARLGRRRRPCETFRTVSHCESFAFRTTHWSNVPCEFPFGMCFAATIRYEDWLCNTCTNEAEDLHTRAPDLVF